MSVTTCVARVEHSPYLILPQILYPFGSQLLEHGDFIDILLRFVHRQHRFPYCGVERINEGLQVNPLIQGNRYDVTLDQAGQQTSFGIMVLRSYRWSYHCFAFLIAESSFSINPRTQLLTLTPSP